jgi:hypothetical protein
VTIAVTYGRNKVKAGVNVREWSVWIVARFDVDAKNLAKQLCWVLTIADCAVTVSSTAAIAHPNIQESIFGTELELTAIVVRFGLGNS